MNRAIRTAVIQSRELPESHPVRRLFRSLADRALNQSSLPDKDLLLYLSDLLINFMYIENLYKLKGEQGKRLEYLVDMLDLAAKIPRHQKKTATSILVTTAFLCWGCSLKAWLMGGE